jgi:hypothetical protein
MLRKLAHKKLLKIGNPWASNLQSYLENKSLWGDLVNFGCLLSGPLFLSRSGPMYFSANDVGLGHRLDSAK